MVENWNKEGKKETKENKVARCHPAVSKYGKNSMSAALGRGHAHSQQQQEKVGVWRSLTARE